MPVIADAAVAGQKSSQRTHGHWFTDLTGIVVTVVAINLLTMPAEEYAGDPMAARMATAELINNQRLAVPGDATTAMGQPGQFFYRRSDGAYYCKYGIANTLVYLIPMAVEKILSGNVGVPAENVIYLNLFNVLLSGVSAVYLVLIARRYTNSRKTIWIFVLGSFYATFWWNYLRTQTFEIYLTLFVLGLFYHLRELVASPADKKGRRHAIATALYLGALILAKSFYLLLVPPALIVLFWRTALRDDGRIFARNLIWFATIVASCVALLLWSNWYRFDSAFHSGYEQFKEEHPMFSSENLGPAVFGFLFGGRSSIFLHFPVLIFALIGWPRFWKSHRWEAMGIVVGTLLVFCAVCPYRFWTGAACYGPRYLLPIAPLAALPFIYFLDRLGFSRRWKYPGRIIVAAVLVFSAIGQVAVNSLPFFFRYELQAVLDPSRTDIARPYFHDRPSSLINIDFMLEIFDCPSAFRRDFVSSLDIQELVRLESIKFDTRLNYYWFPKTLSSLR